MPILRAFCFDFLKSSSFHRQKEEWLNHAILRDTAILLFNHSGGQRGIRTLDTLLTYTRVPVSFQLKTITFYFMYNRHYIGVFDNQSNIKN